ncbi:MAG: radical SAM protein [Desulfobacterales bacterium]|nr:radical SAM protein [Desulfobacterales bacterium]
MSQLERIRSLTVILTTSCNLACSYCYQNAKKNQRMPWATMKAALDLLLASRSDPVQIVFLGGEPLIEFPMIRRAVEYVAKKDPPNKRIQFRISTNGTLLTEPISAFLEAHSFELRISFDGAAQDARGAGTFAMLDRLLGQLREEREAFLRRNVTVCTTVNPATIARLPESVDYFLGKGVSNISIGASLIPEPSWNVDRIDELDSLFGRVFESSLEHWRRTGQVPLLNFRGGKADPTRATGDKPMCALPMGSILTVDVDGQAVGCPVLAGSYQRIDSTGLARRWAAMRMGSIHDPRFARRHAAFPEAARQAGMFDHKQDKYSSYGRCGDCRYVDECSLCPGSIAHVLDNKDPNRVSDFCCAFNLISLKHRDRLPGQREPMSLRNGPAGAEALMERWRRMAEGARSTGH